MTGVVDRVGSVGYYLFAGGFVAVCLVVAPVVVPAVSLVALPIFAFKSTKQWLEHRSLYNQTLDSRGFRVRFGRVEGQDYTRWDGKMSDQVRDSNELEQALLHDLLNKYAHGGEIGFRTDQTKWPPDSAFATQKDLDWLAIEIVRKEKEELLDSDLKMLRLFAKLLIPVVGIFWALNSERRCCIIPRPIPKGRNRDKRQDTHWEAREAIRFHQQVLFAKLGVPS